MMQLPDGSVRRRCLLLWQQVPGWHAVTGARSCCCANTASHPVDTQHLAPAANHTKTAPGLPTAGAPPSAGARFCGELLRLQALLLRESAAADCGAKRCCIPELLWLGAQARLSCTSAAVSRFTGAIMCRSPLTALCSHPPLLHPPCRAGVPSSSSPSWSSSALSHCWPSSASTSSSAELRSS